MRPVMRSALAMSLLGALGACFGTQDLKLGELESRDPPKGHGEAMSVDAAAPATAETPPLPSHHDDEDDAHDASVAQVPVDAAADAAVSTHDAGVVDAAAIQDAMLSSTDAGSDAAYDSGRVDAGDAGDAGGDAGDAGDSGRGSLLCTLEPWHCL